MPYGLIRASMFRVTSADCLRRCPQTLSRLVKISLSPASWWFGPRADMGADGFKRIGVDNQFWLGSDR